ncbi:unnamed protein product, partial [Oncorhynchus mykiss]
LLTKWNVLFSWTVPPPENVTVSCNNLQTTVDWNHSELLRRPLFKLKITGDHSSWENSTKQHHYDLSPLMWNAKELDRYFVKITAIDEMEESASQKSSIFTFNRYLTADIHCKYNVFKSGFSKWALKAYQYFSSLYRNRISLCDVKMTSIQATERYSTSQKLGHTYSFKSVQSCHQGKGWLL